MNVEVGSSLKDLLHTASQGLTYPVIIALVLFMAYALYCVGSVVVELVVERRHFKVVLPDFLRAVNNSCAADLPEVVKGSGMLLRQKKALLTLFRNGDLPEEARWALAKKLLNQEEGRYRRIVGRTDTAAKVSPMLGLMGTLIPLGPGIVALGQGDTATLAGSLLMAFDTTVAGLVTAAVCMIVSKVRKNWYTEYSDALEASVTTVLEKIDLLRQSGDMAFHVDMPEEQKMPDQSSTVSTTALGEVS